MPRVLTYCEKCDESLQGRDGGVCRYCHQLFCDECGDIGVRECNECGEEQAVGESWRQGVEGEREREKELKEMGGGDRDEEYGEIGDIDYFGEDVA